jgi:homoaconitase/3-isopropylmalate dehydratase large subunit
MATGMTITEKILARASGQDQVRPGDFISARADTVVICDLGWPSVGPLFESLDVNVVEPERVVVVFDHTAPAETAFAAELHATWRAFCARQGVTRVHDVGDQGISHVISVENGYARPGTLLVNVDTHANTCGAVGCVSMAMGTDLVADLALGWNWYQVPPSILVELEGTPPPGVLARDVAQHAMTLVGTDLGSGAAIEFRGTYVDAASISERMTLCNWSRKVQAVVGIMNPDDRVEAYLRARNAPEFVSERSDPDARYAERFRIDVSRLEPLVAAPGDPLATTPVSAVAGTPIHQAFLGSCAGGGIEDFRVAAEVLRGRRIHPGVRMIASPGSQEVWRAAEREGLLRDLADAGVLVTGSTCGACYGGAGVLAPDEVCISTSTENFAGRMGSTRSSIYLASALTVAASALAGAISGHSSTGVPQ